MNEPEGKGSDAPGAALRTAFIRAAREILQEPETAFDLRKVAERAGRSRTAPYLVFGRTEDGAERAGRSRTAPYLVFGRTEDGGGLEALRVAVAVSGLDDLVAALSAVRAGTPDPEAAFHAAGRVYLEFARAHPRLFRLMFGPEVARALRAAAGGGAAPAGGGAPELTRARAELEWLLRSVVDDCQGVGALPPGDTQALLTGVWALLHGSAMLLLDGQLEATGAAATADAAAGVATGLLLDRAALPVAAAARALLESEVRLGLVPREPERPRPAASRVAGTATPRAGARAGVADPPLPLDQVRAMLARSPALRRARRMRGAVDGSRILWIDDAPEQSESERRTLAELGAEVVAARTTAEALERLAAARPAGAGGRAPAFDVIVSDIARPTSPAAGVEGLPRLRAAAPATPVVFYVRRLDPGADRPPGSFGITNRPDELLHLLLDVLERTRV